MAAGGPRSLRFIWPTYGALLTDGGILRHEPRKRCKCAAIDGGRQGVICVYVHCEAICAHEVVSKLSLKTNQLGQSTD